MADLVDTLPFFATAQSTKARVGETGMAHCARTYVPSYPGVHLCGADHEDNRFFTILDAPLSDDATAIAAWKAVRAECQAMPDEADFTVDLNMANGDQLDDFWSNRQQLPRIVAILRQHGARL